MNNGELLDALGFVKGEHSKWRTLRIDRGDGKALCTIYVSEDSWNGSLLYWARDDRRGGSDVYFEAKSFAEFLQKLLLWAVERGRHDMKAEIFDVIHETRRKIDNIEEVPSMDSLRSGLERDEDRAAWMDGRRPKP